MILDSMQNARTYYGLGSVWKKAFQIMEQFDASLFTSGKHLLEDGISQISLEYRTKTPEDVLMEAHVKYADIMFLVHGQEIVYFKPATKFVLPTSPYNEDTDTLLAKLDDDALPLYLETGQFVVFMPQDAHAPGCIWQRPLDVRRIVIKVPLF